MGSKDKVMSKSMLFSFSANNEARLALDGWKNFLRYKVFVRPKDKSEKTKVVCNIPLNKVVMYGIIEELKNLYKQKEGYKFEIISSVPVWEDNKMVEGKTEVAGSVILGRKKDVDGEVINYIAVVNKYDKTFMFRLGLTPFLQTKLNDTTVSPETASNSWARWYGDLLKDIMGTFKETDDDPEWNPPNKK